GATAAAPGRDQLLRQPRLAGDLRQPAAAGPPARCGADPGPLPGQLHARYRRPVRPGQRPEDEAPARGLRPDPGYLGLAPVALRGSAVLRPAHGARRAGPGCRRTAVTGAADRRGRGTHRPAGPAT